MNADGSGQIRWQTAQRTMLSLPGSRESPSPCHIPSGDRTVRGYSPWAQATSVGGPPLLSTRTVSHTPTGHHGCWGASIGV